MSNIWQRKVQELTDWRVDNVPERKKELYNKAMAFLMMKCEQLDSQLFNQFDLLDGIVWTTDQAGIPCENALGCAELSRAGGKIYSLFYDDPRFDFFIQSMELIHHGLGEYYIENEFEAPIKLANDIPHYAANVMTRPYAWYYDQGFKVTSDWLLFRKATVIPIFIYNVKYLVVETERMRKEIIAGTAPRGTNPYWSGVPNSPAKTKILEWLNQYHLQEHTH